MSERHIEWGYCNCAPKCDEWCGLGRCVSSAPQASQPPQGAVDMLCDSNYIAGLKAGWNFCCADDHAGMQRAIEARIRDRVEWGAASPLPAPQEPVAWRAWAPGFSSHFVLLADEESAKSLAVKFGDGKYEPLYAAPAPVSPEAQDEPRG